jgi:lipid-binding SYLF domain-containing protein
MTEKQRNIMAMKTLASILLACCVAFATADAATEQKSSIKRSAFCANPPNAGTPDPEKILNDARGLAIIRVLKAGFVFSGKGGQGVVWLARGTVGRVHPSSGLAARAGVCRSARR